MFLFYFILSKILNLQVVVFFLVEEILKWFINTGVIHGLLKLLLGSQFYLHIFNVVHVCYQVFLMLFECFQHYLGILITIHVGY
jgi:hypothetical protein